MVSVDMKVLLDSLTPEKAARAAIALVVLHAEITRIGVNAVMRSDIDGALVVAETFLERAAK